MGQVDISAEVQTLTADVTAAIGEAVVRIVQAVEVSEVSLLDDAAANRALLLSRADEVLAALAALDAKVSAPPPPPDVVPPASVIIDINNAQQAKLATLEVGQSALLRHASGAEHTLVRYPDLP